jgi:catechol 1,2-dioxygenase
MAVKIAQTEEVKKFLNIVSGTTSDKGNPRTKKIVHRILTDLFNTIEEFDVQPQEFWAAIDYFNDLGQSMEAGLLTAGLGLEHFLDLRMDAEDKAAGVKQGTPRTIEGPLYVANAPLSKGSARLDDGTDKGEVLFMHGVVRDLDGKPVGGAIVDVWHANTKGFYSFFDKSQTKYNLRRRIETGPDGRYKFQTIIPAGYGCAPDGPTQRLLDQLGRHGQRPAHIHFFVWSPGHRHLTTQINIAGDKYLYDDFAFATREGLIPKIVRHEDAKNGTVTLANGTAAHRDAAALLGYGLGASHTTEMAERFSRRIRGMKEKELNTPFSEIEFDFTLTALAKKDAEDVVNRRRVEAA